MVRASHLAGGSSQARSSGRTCPVPQDRRVAAVGELGNQRSPAQPAHNPVTVHIRARAPGGAPGCPAGAWAGGPVAAWSKSEHEDHRRGEVSDPPAGSMVRPRRSPGLRPDASTGPVMPWRGPGSMPAGLSPPRPIAIAGNTGMRAAGAARPLRRPGRVRGGTSRWWRCRRWTRALIMVASRAVGIAATVWLLCWSCASWCCAARAASPRIPARIMTPAVRASASLGAQARPNRPPGARAARRRPGSGSGRVPGRPPGGRLAGGRGKLPGLRCGGQGPFGQPGRWFGGCGGGQAGGGLP